MNSWLRYINIGALSVLFACYGYDEGKEGEEKVDRLSVTEVALEGDRLSIRGQTPEQGAQIAINGCSESGNCDCPAGFICNYAQFAEGNGRFDIAVIGFAAPAGTLTLSDGKEQLSLALEVLDDDETPVDPNNPNPNPNDPNPNPNNPNPNPNNPNPNPNNPNPNPNPNPNDPTGPKPPVEEPNPNPNPNPNPGPTPPQVPAELLEFVQNNLPAAQTNVDQQISSAIAAQESLDANVETFLDTAGDEAAFDTLVQAIVTDATNCAASAEAGVTASSNVVTLGDQAVSAATDILAANQVTPQAAVINAAVEVLEAVAPQFEETVTNLAGEPEVLAESLADATGACIEDVGLALEHIEEEERPELAPALEALANADGTARLDVIPDQITNEEGTGTADLIGASIEAIGNDEEGLIADLLELI